VSQTPPASAPGPAAVIILAAGEGTRMKSSVSKLLHPVGGQSMLSYAVDAATALQPERIAVVIGHRAEEVQAHLDEIAPHVQTVLQGTDAYGTGYAVQCALEALEDIDGDVIITMGDVPLLGAETLGGLLVAHREHTAAVTLLTAEVADPGGYGRIVRGADDAVEAIVEHKDATAEQLALAEINAGIYVFDAALLRSALGEITADNAAGELLLTDVVAVAHRRGRPVSAYRTDDVWQTEGVNDRVQLARMHAEMNRRIVEGWMRAGVTVLDPASTWIHASVDLAPDVTLLPGTSLEGATSVGAGATIGPETTLSDVEVGEGATVVRAHAVLSIIGSGATVGPYAYLRPGTQLGATGKIGTFVETKNARIGEGAKVPHQSYVGDADIGEHANIGAGVIFANYDGATKATSTVGNYSFVGSNSVLAAPVVVADGAYVAAGSTITLDVAPGELAVGRGRQRNVAGWVARRRAGTKLAKAAEAALQGEQSPEPNEERR
jgi:bifunctional UDP-N-acetylglucosamine pyrophosphorylase / glucosamine-1-phosphate N-acetyltransferase